MAETVLNKSRPEGDFTILFRICGELWRYIKVQMLGCMNKLAVFD